MDASCGPSSAVSQLAKHTQRDQTLQRERISGPIEGAGFRAHGGIDGRLNQEFHQFNQSEMGNSFQPSFQPSFQNQHQHQHQPQFQPQFQNQSKLHNVSQFNQFQNQAHNQHISNQVQNSVQNVGEGWVQDFNQMSIQAPQKSDWQMQFMQMRQGQNTRPMAPMGFSGMTSQRGNIQANSSQLDDQSLAAQFDQVEREMEMDTNGVDMEKTAEMNGVEVEVEKADPSAVEMEKSRSNNEQFAEAARQVQDSMIKGQASQETTEKFQQSNFLKLMTSISDRQVELSEDGDKLVTKSGQDIREHMSDPLKHEKEPDYHRLMHEARESFESPNYQNQFISGHSISGDRDTLRYRPTESEAIRSHLPDPLAHIKDGQLSGDLSSLQAAQVISGGQVQADSWMEDMSWEQPRPGRGNSILSPSDQELFDDYRHDDDNF